jgi:hypothetical protein
MAMIRENLRYETSVIQNPLALASAPGANTRK